MRQLCNLIQIIHHSGHEMTCPVFVIEPERQGLQMGK